MVINQLRPAALIQQHKQTLAEAKAWNQQCEACTEKNIKVVASFLSLNVRKLITRLKGHVI